MTTTPLPPTWITLMPEAEQIVKGKHVYKRFIDGTPLSNDVPCWMVEFALEQVAQARADLEAENQRLREALMLALKVMEGFDRFRRMMTDGPDASDKLLAEDYAEVAFLQAVEAIDRARAALESKP